MNLENLPDISGGKVLPSMLAVNLFLTARPIET